MEFSTSKAMITAAALNFAVMAVFFVLNTLFPDSLTKSMFINMSTSLSPLLVAAFAMPELRGNLKHAIKIGLFCIFTEIILIYAVLFIKGIRLGMNKGGVGTIHDAALISSLLYTSIFLVAYLGASLAEKLERDKDR